MRVYGASKHDPDSGKYGCCGGALRSHKRDSRDTRSNYVRRFEKLARRRARNEGKKACKAVDD